jgi:hypothetical protein
MTQRVTLGVADSEAASSVGMVTGNASPAPVSRSLSTASESGGPMLIGGWWLVA